jgi:hypothetical protein
LLLVHQLAVEHPPFGKWHQCPSAAAAAARFSVLINGAVLLQLQRAVQYPLLLTRHQCPSATAAAAAAARFRRFLMVQCCCNIIGQ